MNYAKQVMENQKVWQTNIIIYWFGSEDKYKNYMLNRLLEW